MDQETKPGSLLPETPPTEPEEAPAPLGEHEADIWGGERPDPPAETASTAPEAGVARAPKEAPPESQWWPETRTPVPPLVPPPAHRGRLVAIALAVLLVAGGGVAAVVVATSSSRRSASLPTTGPSQTAAGPLIPTAPASFAATAKSGGEVDLSWVAGGAGLTGYDLYRDGQLLTQIDATLTSYRDLGVAPTTTYSYGLEAVSAAGRSVQSTLIVSTPKAPPLSEARVTDGFSIKGKFTKENFTNRNEGEKYSSFWFFTPACGGAQACDVKTSGEGEGNKEVLKLNKGTYHGVVQIPHGGQCGSTKLTETQTITFSVTKAAFTNGVWKATEISGTTRFDVPGTPGCLAGYGIVAFTGTLAS